MKRSICFFFVLAASVVQPVFATPYLKIESAPIFADPGTGANQILGSFSTSYLESFPTPGRILQITNTGALPDGTPSNPGLPYGYDYFIKTQVGDTAIPPTKQLVINLEGTSIGGQGGMIDLMSNLMAADEAQLPAPAGKVYWADFIRVGAYDIPFPAAPSVLTNSRIQNYVLLDDHDPASENLLGAWQNILNGDGSIPIVISGFDANGLDIEFEIDGGLYPMDALEDSGLRMVTFFEGPDPAGNGGGPNGGTVPEPGSLALLMLGLISVLSRKKSIQGASLARSAK